MSYSFRKEEKSTRQEEKRKQKKIIRQQKKAERKQKRLLSKEGIATSTRKKENDKIRQVDKKLNLVILILAFLLGVMLVVVFSV